MVTDATVSPSAPTTSVGVCTSGQVLSVFQPVSGIAAFSDGRSFAASSVPPPPMEWPITPSREASTRLRTELLWVR